VTITLEVPAGSSWGPDCSLSQIYSQAGEETANRVEQTLLKAGIRARILSKKVVAIIATPEADGE
jgi:hypothetical protein